jgi:hypothetical protein
MYLRRAYVIAFTDRLMVTGKLLETCRDFYAVVRRAESRRSRGS